MKFVMRSALNLFARERVSSKWGQRILYSPHGHNGNCICAYTWTRMAIWM